MIFSPISTHKSPPSLQRTVTHPAIPIRNPLGTSALNEQHLVRCCEFSTATSPAERERVSNGIAGWVTSVRSLLLTHRSNHNIFCLNPCLSFYNIFNLCPACIIHLSTWDYDICRFPRQIHDHIFKSFCFQKQFCRRFLFDGVCHVYHAGHGTFSLILRQIGIIDNFQ